MILRMGLSAKTLPLEPTSFPDVEHMTIPEAKTFVVDASPPSSTKVPFVSEIIRRYPDSRVLIIKEKIIEDRVFPFLRLGAKGVLSYNRVRQDLRKALKAVAEGGFWVPRRLLSHFVGSMIKGTGNRRVSTGPAEISQREREVLTAVLAGLANKEIASLLDISERTVKFHVHNLLFKLGVQRRSDLILLHFHEKRLAS